jgi:hypothetical protein
MFSVWVLGQLNSQILGWPLKAHHLANPNPSPVSYFERWLVNSNRLYLTSHQMCSYLQLFAMGWLVVDGWCSATTKAVMMRAIGDGICTMLMPPAPSLGVKSFASIWCLVVIAECRQYEFALYYQTQSGSIEQQYGLQETYHCYKQSPILTALSI